jgi:hypothetical protein
VILIGLAVVMGFLEGRRNPNPDILDPRRFPVVAALLGAVLLGGILLRLARLRFRGWNWRSHPCRPSLEPSRATLSFAELPLLRMAGPAPYAARRPGQRLTWSLARVATAEIRLTAPAVPSPHASLGTQTASLKASPTESTTDALARVSTCPESFTSRGGCRDKRDGPMPLKACGFHVAAIMRP